METYKTVSMKNNLEQKTTVLSFIAHVFFRFSQS